MPRNVPNASQAPSAAAGRRAPPLSTPTISRGTQRLRPRTSYLMARGPVPSASGPEQAAAALRRRLDGAEDLGDNNQEVIDDEILVHVTLKASVSEVVVRSTITHHAFLTKICGELGVAPDTAKLGWKASDDSKTAMLRELQTPLQLESALKTLVKINRNPRRFKSIAMVIFHLNPNAVPYEGELLLLKVKLQCPAHVRPQGWCYVRPGRTHSDNHILLGIEELNLWAKKMYDGSADTAGIIPPDCFRWAPHMPSERDSIATRQYSVVGDNSDYVDGNKEDLLTATLLCSLDVMFPRHNFQQYKGQLHARGMLYARGIPRFNHQYFLDLGMEEGAIGTFLEGTECALKNLSQRDGLQVGPKISLKGKEPARAQSPITVISLSDSESESEMEKDDDFYAMSVEI